MDILQVLGTSRNQTPTASGEVTSDSIDWVEILSDELDAKSEVIEITIDVEEIANPEIEEDVLGELKIDGETIETEQSASINEQTQQSQPLGVSIQQHWATAEADVAGPKPTPAAIGDEAQIPGEVLQSGTKLLGSEKNTLIGRDVEGRVVPEDLETAFRSGREAHANTVGSEPLKVVDALKAHSAVAEGADRGAEPENRTNAQEWMKGIQAKDVRPTNSAPSLPVSDTKNVQLIPVHQSVGSPDVVVPSDNAKAQNWVIEERPVVRAEVGQPSAQRTSLPELRIQSAMAVPSIITPTEFTGDKSIDTSMQPELPSVSFGPTGSGAAPVTVANSSATAVATAMSPRDQAVISQVSQAIEAAEKGGVELRLDPAELGKVRIHMVARDGVMMATISAERPETLDLLRRHADTLDMSFSDQGFGDAELSFQDYDRDDDFDGQRDTDQTSASFERSPEDTAVLSLRQSVDGLDLRL